MKRIMVRISVAHLIVVLSCAGWLAAAPQERVIYGVAQRPQDVFLGDAACAVVDAQPARAVSIEEAVRALAPCMQGLSQRYGVAVSAEKGFVSADGGLSETPGVLIRVPAEIRKDCHILMDLSYSIRERRGGRLFGSPAGVWSGSLERQEPVSAAGSAGLPAWLDGPSLKIDAKLTKLRLGGGLQVALFDKDDNEVELSLPAAAPGTEAVVTFTQSTDEELGPYKVASFDSADPGALKRVLASVPIPAELDASIRKAVRDLFSHLPGGSAK
jgi:hypothetical protein